MKLKDLEVRIEEVPSFTNPKEHYEQYPTPSNIAACILWQAFMLGDIGAGKIVIDLGCGTGRLSYGAALLGSRVVCVDIDEEALYQARRFINESCSECLVDYVLNELRSASALRSIGDCTVIMNPPFGVKSRGADIDFLEVALKLCNRVYSIHKYSDGLIDIIKRMSREYGFNYYIISKVEFPIKYSLPHHKRRIYYVDAVVIRFCKDNALSR